MIDDASVYGLDSDMHMPGDGGDFDDPGTRLSIAAHGCSHGNSIARCDNRVYGRASAADYRVDALDITANRHGDATAGEDETANAHADTAMRGTGPAIGSALHLAHGDSDADTGANMDAEPDDRHVSGESCGWGLPAALLFRAGE